MSLLRGSKSNTQSEKILLSLLVLFLVSACSQPTPPPVEFVPSPDVGPVELIRVAENLDEQTLLDIGVVIFDNQPLYTNERELGAWIFEEIVQNETQYLPYVLRNTLVDSNLWGVVRVLPDTDPSLDLLIEGTIVQSSGINLELHIRATDSTGREWLNKTYLDRAGSADYPESTRYTAKNRFVASDFVDPFQDIYDQINNDLLEVQNSLTSQQLANIPRVSYMVYANDLSPETFGNTLSNDTDGLLTVTSLMAEDDPMIGRLEEMRSRHHVFIDTVDEYYESLFDEMRPVYVTWRDYSRDEIVETRSATRAIYEGDGYGSAGNFLSLSQRYDRYRWQKIFQQEFTTLASGFNNEIAPAILELNRNLHGLSGPMDEQYMQWRRILRELFALEIQSETDSAVVPESGPESRSETREQ